MDIKRSSVSRALIVVKVEDLEGPKQNCMRSMESVEFLLLKSPLEFLYAMQYNNKHSKYSHN
jgi:hypothetical protein